MTSTNYPAWRHWQGSYCSKLFYNKNYDHKSILTLTPGSKQLFTYDYFTLYFHLNVYVKTNFTNALFNQQKHLSLKPNCIKLFFIHFELVFVILILIAVSDSNNSVVIVTALNGTARIRHQCMETTVLSCHRCLISTGVKNEQHWNID